MMDFSALISSLKEKGYVVSAFENVVEATEYIDKSIDKKSVGIGGSMSLEQMGLYEKLDLHNTVYWHHKIPNGETSASVREKAKNTDVYISSVNAITKDGEIVNIDNVCNRVASITYGHEKVYLIIGKNKIEDNFEKALWRARNIASPKNAQRLKLKTPCALKADRCYDCKSEDRICRGLSVLWVCPKTANIEVVLINEDLGY